LNGKIKDRNALYVDLRAIKEAIRLVNRDLANGVITKKQARSDIRHFNGQRAAVRKKINTANAGIKSTRRDRDVLKVGLSILNGELDSAKIGQQIACSSSVQNSGSESARVIGDNSTVELLYNPNTLLSEYPSNVDNNIVESDNQDPIESMSKSINFAAQDACQEMLELYEELKDIIKDREDLLKDAKKDCTGGVRFTS